MTTNNPESPPPPSQAPLRARFFPRPLRKLLIVCLVPILYLYTLSFMTARPAHLGVTDGKLAACPNSPNCVSTQAGDEPHRMAPWPFHGEAAQVKQQLMALISRQPRMRIVTQTDNYLHVEATSRLFRFVDDVEFLIDPANSVIHFRSASRVGYSDLGANRARMEKLRAEWEREN